MTNEQAIETLESLKEQHEWDPAVIDEDDVMALDIAIDALKIVSGFTWKEGEDNGS